LVYQGGDLTPGNLVGSALFGDGAAAVLIGPGEGMFSIKRTSSALLPGTQEMMGYDLRGDGNHLRLKKELPGELAKMAPELIRNFLRDNGVAPEGVANWLIHPGGVKILNLLEEEFELQPSQSQWAWRVLEKFGNMSSASILFVLDEFLKSKSYKFKDKILSIGIGPGLTLEQTLFEVSE
jgi:alkylresorcinol/alkylpyrone synthase